MRSVILATAFVIFGLAGIASAQELTNDQGIPLIRRPQLGQEPVASFTAYIKSVYRHYAAEGVQDEEFKRDHPELDFGPRGENVNLPLDRQDAVGLYQAAKAKLSKNPAALSALKDLYAYWQASMDLLVHSAGDTVTIYKFRTDERWKGLADRQSKLEIEIQN